MRSFFNTCALLALTWQAAAQYPDPLPCSGTCNDTHDPALIRRDSDGTYFRFATSNRISIYSAPSGTGPWEYRGAVLPDCSVIDLPGNCDIWAADVTKVDDLYYLYYSVSEFGSHTSAIGVATSEELDVDTWFDHGSIGLQSSPDTPWNAIDPNLIKVGDRHLLTFGSYWEGLYNVELQEPPLAIQPEPTFNHLAYNTSFPHYIEGSYLFHWGRYYYLFFSSGVCCGYDQTLPPPGEEYRIYVCRSRSPIGGFVDENGVDCLESGGTKVLGSHDFVYGPGGQGVYEMEGYGPVLYYHYADTRVGLADRQKLIGLNPIDFSSGWPVLSPV